MTTILVLAVLGILLLALEVILPGAIIGILGGVLVTASIVLAFVSDDLDAYGAWVRWSTALGIAVVTIVTLSLWLKYFEKTPVGRWMVLDSEIKGAPVDRTETLLGATGTVTTRLRNAGVARINGKKLDVHSETGEIEKGATVRVAKVEAHM